MRPQHPRASREQRSPHTRGPTAPDARARRPHLRAPRRHLPLPDARARGDGAQAASADPEAAPRRGRGPAPPRGDSGAPSREGCERAGAPRSMAALGPRPGVLTLRPVAATREPRTEGGSRSRGWRGRGLGRRGARWGAAVELHLPVSAPLPGPGRPAAGTDSVSSFPSVRTGPRRSGFPAPRPRTCRRARLRTRWGWGGEGRRSASGLLPRIPLLYISLEFDLIAIKKKVVFLS